MLKQFVIYTTEKITARLGVNHRPNRAPFTFPLILSLILLAVQVLPTDARAMDLRTRVPFPSISATTVSKVGPIGMTVSDMDRSIEFYTKILSRYCRLFFVGLSC